MRLEEANHQNAKGNLFFGWRAVRLGDVCSVHPGQHILEADHNREKLGIGYLTGPADFGIIYPTVTKWTEHPKAWCEPGDVLVTVKGAGVGKINLAPTERVAIGRQLMAIRPALGQVTQEFLYQIMTTHFSHLQGSALGATVPGLAREQIESLAIPLPPLPEQKRITTILNEQLSAVEQARAAAAAQLEAARALPAAYLRDVFSASKAKKWPLARLGDLLIDIQAGKSPSCEERPATFDEWGVLKVSAVSWGAFKPEENKVLPKNFAVPPEYEVQTGDLIISRANTVELVGAAVLVNGTRSKLMLSDKTLRLVTKDNLVSKPYLQIALRSRIAREYIEANATGTSSSMRNISQDTIREIQVPLPPLEKQECIAAVLKEQTDAGEKVSCAIERQLHAINKLPAALLRQAFNGEL